MSELMLSPYLRLIGRTGNTRHPGGLKATDLLLKKIGITRNFRILDVGCGAGHTSAHIAKNYGCFVVGLDVSEEALDQGRALYAGEPYFERMSFINAELSHIPFSDDYFDVVLCESVLLFVKNKEAALKEIARLVKENGYLLLNELCVGESKNATTIKKYFARPEMNAFLTTVDELSALIDPERWAVIVHDEQTFTLKDQLMSDFAQFGNKKGLLQLFELIHSSFTNKEMRSDLWSMAQFLLHLPPRIFTSLLSLRVLARKKS